MKSLLTPTLSPSDGEREGFFWGGQTQGRFADGPTLG